MPKVKVNQSRLSSIDNDFQQAIRQLGMVTNQFQAVASNIDWDIKAKSNVNRRITRLSRELQDELNALQSFARFTQEAQRRYDQTEREISQRIGHVGDSDQGSTYSGVGKAVPNQPGLRRPQQVSWNGPAEGVETSNSTASDSSFIKDTLGDWISLVGEDEIKFGFKENLADSFDFKKFMPKNVTSASLFKVGAQWAGLGFSLYNKYSSKKNMGEGQRWFETGTEAITDIALSGVSKGFVTHGLKWMSTKLSTASVAKMGLAKVGLAKVGMGAGLAKVGAVAGAIAGAKVIAVGALAIGVAWGVNEGFKLLPFAEGKGIGEYVSQGLPKLAKWGSENISKAAQDLGNKVADGWNAVTKWGSSLFGFG